MHALKAGRKYSIAVDLGGTNTRTALVGEEGTILRKIAVSTPEGRENPSEMTDHLIACIRRVIPSVNPEEIAGIGVSAAGPVDFSRGTIVHPPNLPFPEIPVIRPLHEAFNIPVFLVNDCHAGVIGEALFGALRGCRNGVYITLSTGIGAGIIAGGRLLFGSRCNAGEVGHFPVDSRYSAPCGCGHTGHWEGYASGRNIPTFFAIWREYEGKEAPGFDPATTEGIFSAAQGGDRLAREFAEAVGRINARGISATVVAYDPAMIVLDGTIVLKNPDLVLPPIQRYADRFLPLPPLRITGLEGYAPLLGASVIAKGYDTPFGSFADCTEREG